MAIHIHIYAEKNCDKVTKQNLSYMYFRKIECLYFITKFKKYLHSQDENTSVEYAEEGD